MQKKRKGLLKEFLLPLAVGLLAGWLSRGAMPAYEQMVQPAFAPPAWLFPLVWTLLYLLMGASSWLVQKSGCALAKSAKKIYWTQLAVNFFWPLVFFNLGLYGVAFYWLLLLLVLVIMMIRRFYACDPKAAWLQLPYLLWLLFAAVLNYSVWQLNA